MRVVEFSHSFNVFGMPHAPYSAFATTLTKARTAAGLAKQADLATRLGVKQQTVSRWEAGTHRPRADQLPALAQAVKGDLDLLRRLAGFDSLPAAPFVEPFPIDRLDPVTFEAFASYFAQERFPSGQVRRLGKTGHTQDGGDVVLDADGKRTLIQCKRVDQFGPAQVAKAIAAASGYEADAFVLALSRIASPQAATALDKAGWVLWDLDYFSREIRRLPPESQDRLVDIFFKGHRLALLGRSEPGPWRTTEEFFRPFDDPEKAFSHSWALLGRASDVRAILSRLSTGSEGRATILSAPGGMGKSRLLREVAEQMAKNEPGTTVRFLVPTEDVRSVDLESLGSRPKVLIVDDAHDRDGLALLLSYAADPATHTRLLLASRPYGVERIQREAAVQGVESEVQRLAPLTRDQLLPLAKEVLATFEAPLEWAEVIVDTADRSPLMVAMGARIVARDRVSMELVKNQPAVRNYILGKFAKILGGDLGQGRDGVHEQVLQVLALVQPFHIEDPQLYLLIEALTGLDASAGRRAVQALVDAGVAFPRAGQHRLMPDVLGDYLIESSCLTAGRLSAFADTALAATPPALLTNLMVNLGRLDWRINEGDTSKSTLLDAAWLRLDAAADHWDPRLNAAKAVAMFQPRQAIDFVTRMARARRALEALPDILRNAALNEANFEEAGELLWELARLDDRETHPFPSHPMRVLTEMAEYHPRKPVAICRKALALGQRLALDARQWEAQRSPLEIVRPLLAVEGTTHRSDGRTLHMRSFFVDYEVAKPLREQIINLVLNLLSNPRPRVAKLAAEELQHVLRYPHGILGAAPPRQLFAHLEAEFVEVLSRINTLLPTLSPITALTIGRQMRWMAKHGRGGVDIAAQKVLAAMPTGPAYELLVALETGHPLDLEDDFGAESRKRSAAYVDTVAERLETEWPEPERRRQSIEGVLAEMRSAGLQANAASRVISRLMQRDIAFAEALVEDALKRPTSETARYAGQGLWRLLQPDGPPKAMAYARRAQDGSIDLKIALANALSGLSNPDEEQLDLLRVLLASEHPAVVSAAARVLWHLRDDNPALALELVLGANIKVEHRVLDDLMLALQSDSGTLAPLSADAAKALLAKLEPIPELEGHWADQVLAQLSERFPIETMEFFVRRIERSAMEGGNRFRPANHGPYSHEPLRFVKTAQRNEIIAKMWGWLRANHGRKGMFAYRAGDAFEAMFLSDEAFVVQFFDSQIQDFDADDLRAMADLMGRASGTFIFDHANFVIRVMDRAQTLDPGMVEEIGQALSISSHSGVRSGLVGEPTEEDLEEQRRSKEILGWLSKLSPARTIYEMALKHAEWSIERSIRDGQILEDD